MQRIIVDGIPMVKVKGIIISEGTYNFYFLDKETLKYYKEEMKKNKELIDRMFDFIKDK